MVSIPLFSRRLFGASIVAFYFTTLVFPAALFNKVIFILIMGGFAVSIAGRSAFMKVGTLSPLFVLGIFLYGYVLSVFGHSDGVLAQQFLLSVTVLFLIYPICWYGVNIDWVTKFSGVCLSLATAVYFYVIFAHPGSAVAEMAISSLSKNSLVAIGEREFSGATLSMFQFGSAPFLYLPFALFLDSFLERPRLLTFLGLIVVAIGCVTSTSRGLVVVCLLASVFLMMQRLDVRRQLIGYCVVAVIGVFSALYLISETVFFSASEPSNLVKIGHLKSFFENLTVSGLLFGEGLASIYFSIGRDEFIAHTEITPLDFFRYVGPLLTVVLFWLLLFPCSVYRCVSVAGYKHAVLFLLYLLLSVTNPVLFNSYGLLVVLWYWSHVLKGCDVGASSVLLRQGQQA